MDKILLVFRHLFSHLLLLLRLLFLLVRMQNERIRQNHHHHHRQQQQQRQFEILLRIRRNYIVEQILLRHLFQQHLLFHHDYLFPTYRKARAAEAQVFQPTHIKLLTQKILCRSNAFIFILRTNLLTVCFFSLLLYSSSSRPKRYIESIRTTKKNTFFSLILLHHKNFCV